MIKLKLLDLIQLELLDLIKLKLLDLVSNTCWIRKSVIDYMIQ